jgi:ribonucleotide monophosphatase NagD (HAD superfamily)
MKLYFDIDGVLIAQGRKPANYVAEFLKIATEKHDCYWLTTHCKDNSEASIAIDRSN